MSFVEERENYSGKREASLTVKIYTFLCYLVWVVLILTVKEAMLLEIDAVNGV